MKNFIKYWQRAFLSLVVLGNVCLASEMTIFREISDIDNPDILRPGESLERNLYRLDSAASHQVTLDLKPWANKHWQLDSGTTAWRYADTYFNLRYSFRSRWNYIKKYPVSSILRDRNPESRREEIDKLSPAEKYDLLVGDYSGTLSSAQWLEGEKQRVGSGLKSWMGICDGSAAASVMYPEPKHAVKLLAPSGDTITFHILDIKAMASLLWSVYNVDVPVIGSRCFSRFPRRDFSGAITNDSCFNNNPGAFHIAITNFLGIKKKPIIINRDKSIEVWNVPVVGYELSYFNIANGRSYTSLSSAKVNVADYRRDRYRKHRTPGTVALVGVKATITIARGMTTLRDSTAKSSLDRLSYVYDLELDSNGKILGGEWHRNFHPDFMWSVDSDLQPLTVGDLQIGQEAEWNGGLIPSEWLASIRLASAKSQPLEKIVRRLIELSQ